MPSPFTSSFFISQLTESQLFIEGLNVLPAVIYLMLVFTSTKSQSRGLISFDNGHLKQHWLRHTHSFCIAFCVQWCLFYVWTIKSGFQVTFPMPPIYQVLANPHTKGHKCEGPLQQRAEDWGLVWLCWGLPLLLSRPRNFGSIKTSKFGTLSFPLKTWPFAFLFFHILFFFSLLSEFIKTI